MVLWQLHLRLQAQFLAQCGQHSAVGASEDEAVAAEAAPMVGRRLAWFSGSWQSSGWHRQLEQRCGCNVGHDGWPYGGDARSNLCGCGP